MMNRTSSGVDLYSRLTIRELVQTDLPEPVVPAISTWGSLAMSPMMRLPPMSLPTAKATLALCPVNSRDSMTSRMRTGVTARLGTSMPTADILPGLRIHAEAAEGVRQPLGIAAHFGAGLGEAARRALFQQGDGRILVLLLRLGQLLLDLAADLLGGLLEVHGSDSRLGLGRPGLGGRFLLGGLQHFVRGGGLPPGKEGLLVRLQGMILRDGGIFSVQGDVNL